MRTRLAALTATGLVLFSSASLAEERWTGQASIYGYLPDIGGTTAFPVDGGSNVTVDAKKIIESLKFTFMGSLQARKGAWGIYTDVLYLDVGASKSQTRDFAVGGVGLPAGVDGNLHYDLKGLAWTLGGTYRIANDPNSAADVVFGARLLDIDQTLRYELNGNLGSLPLPGRSGESTAGLSNWDAVVGVKGRLAFGDRSRWFMPYYFDIGAGDSDLTWQAIAGVGYSFGWGDVVAAWRYLDYEMKAGKKIETLNFNGPAIAAVFRW